ncbi:lamin tail domain-containing protein [Haloplanus sp. C73]|uniref:lamin tail domain-containing protein n=1 Tax=Haloplanus sp. C73 TaxID=3421641 RepID=UPI003EB7AACD
MRDWSPSLRLLLVVAFVVLAGCSGAPAPDGTPSATATPTSASPSSAPPTQTTTSTDANGTLAVHFINVGQSVSTLVVSPTGETMLIDTGHYHDDGAYVLQYLQQRGIDRIDHLVVSHNDADHIGGNAAVIEYYETEADGIGAVYDPGIAASTQTYQAYLDAVEQYDVPLYETREGDQLPFEGVDVQVLGPPEPYLENGARNENSIVLRFSHGQTSFLFTGDAEDDQESYLVSRYGSGLQSTMLKAGHHGSASSTSAALLDASQPNVAVISSAYDSQYGHPNEAVLQRLSERSLPTYWTATHGNIVLASNGSAVEVRTQRAATTAPLDLRSGAPVDPGTSGGVTPRARYDAVGESTELTAVSDGGTTTQTPPEEALVVETVQADAPGDDRENLNEEYVVFRNTGSDPLDLSGWTVADAADHTYTVPDGYTLAGGETVTLHTGSGSDSATDLYWGADAPIWNNGGDTVRVRTANGTLVVEEAYA